MRYLWPVLVAVFMLQCAGLPAVPARHRGVVRFELLADPGHVFEIRGSWNSWEGGQHRLVNLGDYYYIEIELPRGTYEYVFINEKNEHFLPPHIEARVPDGFGGFNGVLYVP